MQQNTMMTIDRIPLRISNNDEIVPRVSVKLVVDNTAKKMVNAQNAIIPYMIQANTPGLLVSCRRRTVTLSPAKHTAKYNTNTMKYPNLPPILVKMAFKMKFATPIANIGHQNSERRALPLKFVRLASQRCNASWKESDGVPCPIGIPGWKPG